MEGCGADRSSEMVGVSGKVGGAVMVRFSKGKGGVVHRWNEGEGVDIDMIP